MTSVPSLDDFELRLAWLNEDGSTSVSWSASTEHYEGQVPAVGDTLVVSFDDDYDAGMVVERYHVDNGDVSAWLIVMKLVQLNADRWKLVQSIRLSERPS